MSDLEQRFSTTVPGLSAGVPQEFREGLLSEGQMGDLNPLPVALSIIFFFQRWCAFTILASSQRAVR